MRYKNIFKKKNRKENLNSSADMRKRFSFQHHGQSTSLLALFVCIFHELEQHFF